MILLGLMFLISNYACTENPTRTKESYNSSFQEYLKENFSIQIPNEQHFFFLVPDGQCENCNYYSADRVSGEIKDKLTIISEYPSERFAGFDDVHYERKDQLTTMPLVHYENKIVVTHHGAINDIYPVTDFYKQIEELNK